jgi:hypothetical protein
MIDADTRTVRQHLTELENQLTASGQSRRQSDERIGIFVPKRNIETWIHYLKGEAVNEEDEYPYLDNESDCAPYVKRLAENRSQPLPEDAPPSLKAACDELNRII